MGQGVGFDFGGQVCVATNRASDLANGDRLARGEQGLPTAHDLCEVSREDQAKGHGLGVDSVTASNGGRVSMLLHARGERLDQGALSLEAEVGCVTEQDGQGRVEHVRRRHAAVKPARRLTGELLDVGQEGDDVVARRARPRGSSRESARDGRLRSGRRDQRRDGGRADHRAV